MIKSSCVGNPHIHEGGLVGRSPLSWLGLSGKVGSFGDQNLARESCTGGVFVTATVDRFILSITTSLALMLPRRGADAHARHVPSMSLATPPQQRESELAELFQRSGLMPALGTSKECRLYRRSRTRRRVKPRFDKALLCGKSTYVKVSVSNLQASRPPHVFIYGSVCFQGIL